MAESSSDFSGATEIWVFMLKKRFSNYLRKSCWMPPLWPGLVLKLLSSIVGLMADLNDLPGYPIPGPASVKPEGQPGH